MRKTRSGIELQRGRVSASVHLSVALPVLSALAVLVPGFIYRAIIIHEFSPEIPFTKYHLEMVLNLLVCWMLGLSLVAFFFGSVLGYIISAPLRQMSELLLRLADEGETETVSVRGGDEIGLLGHSFNRMVQSMAKYLPERARFVFHNVATGVITTNYGGMLETINATADRILRLSGVGVIGRKYDRVFRPHGGYHAIWEILRETITSSRGVMDREVTIRCLDGEEVALSLNTVVAVDPNTGRNAVVLTLIDLTWLKNVSRQMLQQEKLSAVGSLAAGVAHEIRNPLGALRSLTQMITQSEGSETSRQEYAQVMLSEIDRLNSVVRNLLDFSSPSIEELSQVQFASLIGRAVELSGIHVIKPAVEIIREDAPDTPTVLGNESRILQAILNILLNAADEVSHEGKIFIYTKRTVAGDKVECTIANDGPPIPESLREKIFDPYFTTKDDGTGLGLTIASQIVSQHKGTLKVSSGEGQLTAFTITLPASSQDITPAETATPKQGGTDPS
ncbi:MAG TPA: ATP-binding protein [bacterium]|nr:ATP-binding protein [bacterium]